MQRLVEVRPWESAITGFHDVECVGAGDTVASQVKRDDVSCSPETELKVFEVVVDSCLVVVQILLVNRSAFDGATESMETVCL